MKTHFGQRHERRHRHKAQAIAQARVMRLHDYVERKALAVLTFIIYFHMYIHANNVFLINSEV